MFTHLVVNDQDPAVLAATWRRECVSLRPYRPLYARPVLRNYAARADPVYRAKEKYFLVLGVL